MENYTIAQLKAVAKEHGWKGYSRLRKSELIHFLREKDVLPRRPVPASRLILDLPIPELNEKHLQPKSLKDDSTMEKAWTFLHQSLLTFSSGRL